MKTEAVFSTNLPSSPPEQSQKNETVSYKSTENKDIFVDIEIDDSKEDEVLDKKLIERPKERFKTSYLILKKTREGFCREGKFLAMLFINTVVSSIALFIGGIASIANNFFYIMKMLILGSSSEEDALSVGDASSAVYGWISERLGNLGIASEDTASTEEEIQDL